MNWHDGLILIWQLHGYGFKLWRAHINFIFFEHFGFDLNMKGLGRNPSGKAAAIMIW